ncbi:MAG: GNAT family N-acetyltransferase [Lachnospiraceae bacterium]|nr:GNAT family N-acetyltransferase [Lachnospiraceae bacterium]
MTEEQRQRIEKIQRIEGERVYLRRITEADTDKILHWRNMPHVVERFIYRAEVTRADHEKWLAEQVGTGKVEQFIITLKEGDREIGSQYFTHIDPEKATAEFGIFIGEEDALGKNYGTEVLQLALRYAFEEMQLNDVTLRALSDNERALRSYENCGFRICPEQTRKVVLNGVGREIVFMKKERQPEELSGSESLHMLQRKKDECR